MEVRRVWRCHSLALFVTGKVPGLSSNSHGKGRELLEFIRWLWQGKTLFFEWEAVPRPFLLFIHKRVSGKILISPTDKTHLSIVRVTAWGALGRVEHLASWVCVSPLRSNVGDCGYGIISLSRSNGPSKLPPASCHQLGLRDKKSWQVMVTHGLRGIRLWHAGRKAW